MNKISDDDERAIIELSRAGKSRTEIKKETGISLPTIRRVLRQNGVAIKSEHAGSSYTDEQVSEILVRYESGQVPAHIADNMGLNRRGVLKAIRKKRAEAARTWRQYGEVGPIEFIEAWQLSTSVPEVAERLGMSYTAVAGRAALYRRNGISLKRMSRNKSYDWEFLAEYAELFEEE